MRRSMLPGLLALMCMPNMGDLGKMGNLLDLGEPIKAPPLEALGLPYTKDVAMKTLEREREQRDKFPSRKKRMKARKP